MYNTDWYIIVLIVRIISITITTITITISSVTSRPRRCPRPRPRRCLLLLVVVRMILIFQSQFPLLPQLLRNHCEIVPIKIQCPEIDSMENSVSSFTTNAACCSFQEMPDGL